MNNIVYDIAIIGAGPAGSTLARYLDEKYKVVIIDKKIKRLVKKMKNVVEDY
ncbi:MAG: NAD-binding protein [Clostridiales bacterium]|nr:NAD-binding protein [Clostridiales bacterium]